MKPGDRNLLTDIDGLLVGNAEDGKLKSGVTVVLADRPVTAAVNVMGGAPGTRETALLDPDKIVEGIDAIVLSGGSAFGLDAASGVVDGLRERGRGFEVGRHRVPIVPAAIIFDLENGGDKTWSDSPYPALGRAALDAAGADFGLGSVGAGTGAIAGDIKGGLGSASIRLEGGATVAALAVVNSLGSPIVPGEGRFWAAPFEIGDEFGGLGMADNHDPLAEPRLPKLDTAGAGGNTTIAVVATDAALDKAGCLRMATAAHDGMARAIVPAHTPFDGDCVFALSAGSGDTAPPADQLRIGHAAATCLARAIARGVWNAAPAKGDAAPVFGNKPKG